MNPFPSKKLDPRTSILLVVLTGSVALSPYGTQFLVPALILAVALALSAGARRRALILAVVVIGGIAISRVIALVGGSLVWTTLSLTFDYIARYGVTIGVAVHLFATSTPSSLHASLRALHIPRAITVTLVVMVRFLPTVISESAAVLDAMRLRGLTRPMALVRHPILVVERFTVPMIAASLRAGEDLSSAAIVRGLGSRTLPTALVPPRMGRIDVVWLSAVAVLACVALTVVYLFSTQGRIS
jgi:energy-coupling factor transporter transmembrane protein EcfT